MYWVIVEFLQQIQEAHECTELLQSTLDCSIKTKISNNLNKPLRDYQVDTVTNAINFGRGICILGTGGGKTLITASIIESFRNSLKNKDNFKFRI